MIFCDTLLRRSELAMFLSWFNAKPFVVTPYVQKALFYLLIFKINKKNSISQAANYRKIEKSKIEKSKG